MISKPERIDTPAGPALLKRSPRRTLAISVLPDGTLELAAPELATLPVILAKVAKRLAWLRAQRRNFAAMNTARPPLRYVSGATHRYLGRQYRLKVIAGPEPAVALRGAFLHVTVPEKTETTVSEALRQWYRRRAQEQFTRRLTRWEEWCRTHRLPQPRLRLRSMLKRWGSASRDGSISLNPELVRAPSACIDYVITHEICHLKQPNHGPAFWLLLMQLCPNWTKLKVRLEETGR